MVKPDTYLGDGVYGAFDGYQLWLSTERNGVPHYIALELPVYLKLREYATEKYKLSQVSV